MLTESGHEVDVIIDRLGLPVALIEIKSSERTGDEDTKHLKNIRKDFDQCECYVVSNDRMSRVKDDIFFIYWKDSFMKHGKNRAGALAQILVKNDAPAREEWA